ncbi:GATA zinc finger domain-containing protein 14-like [Telopea speciosissima]|uniref:GATA zinc finger domain-containing protein 14-like n=1 Tax=Telopea speciosissima TaxID=54955 RepID=UPI001CC6AAAA|nr:GATA zinc finger domain-containing protein 14-like [Telopea speciosissima]
MDLKDRLFRLQKGSSTVAEFLLDARSLADALATINNPVAEEDLVLEILRGLGEDYPNVASTSHNSDRRGSFLSHSGNNSGNYHSPSNWSQGRNANSGYYRNNSGNANSGYRTNGGSNNRNNSRYGGNSGSSARGSQSQQPSSPPSGSGGNNSSFMNTPREHEHTQGAVSNL